MKKQFLKIAITGVESTGKSTLAKQLSTYFGTHFLPEIAREYLQKKGVQYQYTESDVIQIGEMQAKAQDFFFENIQKQTNEFDFQKPYFCDTELSVIKIWYAVKYQKKLPAYLENKYLQQDFDVYLLPYPDLAWEYDEMRESENLAVRLSLFEQYKEELTHLQRPYIIIKGTNQERLENAVAAIKDFFGIGK